MSTPQTLAPNLAKEIGLNAELYLKREDLHPYGSHKGRSIPLMVEHYVSQGSRDFVVSSSGNAASAAGRVIADYNQSHPKDPLNLIIYLGKKIDKNKLAALSEISRLDKHISIKQVPNPKQEAFLAEKNNKAKNLRQSTDDLALSGYEELARELAEIKNLAAVFVPTSSGTTAEGLHRGFIKLGINPEIHIIQTPSCHPFVPSTALKPIQPSIATAIVDKIGHRLTGVKAALRESNGTGWIADNEEIDAAIRLTKQCENLDISPNSALSVAGLKKCVQTGRKFSGPVVCLISGS